MLAAAQLGGCSTRALGPVAHSPTSTRDSPAHSCACFGPVYSHVRQLPTLQAQAAARGRRSPATTSHALRQTAAVSLQRLQAAQPTARHGRRQLHVVAAGGPAGGLQKSRSPRGGEVQHWSQTLRSCCDDNRALVQAGDLSCEGMTTHDHKSLAPCVMVTMLSQVDTPGKKLLVGVAVTYVLLVLLVPTANIFIQVCGSLTAFSLHICPAGDCFSCVGAPRWTCTKLVMWFLPCAGVCQWLWSFLWAALRPRLPPCGARRQLLHCERVRGSL